MASSYKSTMILPQTGFDMRANLPTNEPLRLQKWESEKLYWQILEKNKDGKPFVLHDGPPYANGPIHIGHAFNKILKDFVIKSHAQRGFYTPYIPGWDCHGQPIEHKVEVNLGPEKMAKIDQPTLRRLCRELAVKSVDIQREGFKRLGVNADWEHPYLTFIPNFEAGNVEVFKKMYLDGSVYRGRKPIHWCMNCHTALAEAEIEYADEVSPSIFVRFAMDEIPAIYAEAGLTGECDILIWTTTPWTLPANTAVSLNPTADYVIVQVDGKNMIMAEALVESVAKTAKWESYNVFSVDGEPVRAKGTDLALLTYTCPIRRELKGKIIYGDHVTLDTGCGCVHTAPGHGQDDYLVGQKFDIPLLMPVDNNGVLTEDAAPFAGLDVWSANPKIIEWLKEQGTLVAHVDINHSYPHCWRCHQPVIFRATDQWFVSMDETGLRTAALDAIHNKVQWVPGWAQNRIGAMVADRPDWCISRQRSWGVPIPVFKCAKCSETVANEATFDAVIDLFYKEGADAWFTKQPSEYLPEGTCCSKCGCTEVIPEKDILDVWWESGVTHTAVCKHRAAEGLTFPADMYLEGSDQHRGWFQSSLLTSVGAYGVAPYKSVMHCGFTVDANGEKMSKSKGNGVDPKEITDKFGADILRLWVSSVDYSQDVRISDDILKQVSDAYRRIRNTFRFLLGSLNDFSDDKIVSWEGLEPLDRYMMVQLQDLLEEIEKDYDEYHFHYIYRLIYNYVNDLSTVYLDVTKDRLYAEAADSPRRRAVQTVLMNVLEVLVRTLSPILSFTTDEVWEKYPEAFTAAEGRPWTVQLAGWPTKEDFAPAIPEGARAEFDQVARVLEIREAVMKALEDARNAGTIVKNQEADVVITLAAADYALCTGMDAAVFAELYVAATTTFVEGEELAVVVTKSELEKCPRCWNYRQLGTNANHPCVCARCADVLDGMGFVEEA